MSRFAPVVSLRGAQLLEQEGLYGDYHLLLAHQILADPDGWERLFAEIRAKRHIDVIVDNSIIELGEPLTDSALLQAVHIVRADYLVLPDCIDDLPETMYRSFGAAGRIHTEKNLLPDFCEFLAVIQGQTFRECLLCAEVFTRLPRLGAVAVPRGLPRLFRSRYELTKEVYRISKKPIHLLGFSGYLEDDLATAKLGFEAGIMGIDSAVPIREGLAGRWYNYETNRQGLARRDKNYLNQELPLGLNDYVRDNIKWVRDQIA